MKLVQLLAKELKEWPEGISCMIQDGSGKICTCRNGFPDPYDGDWTICGPKSMCTPVYWANIGSNKHELAIDQASAIITKEQWQAEREKMNKPKWIRHRGGKCPVKAGTRVSTKHRDGDVAGVHHHTAQNDSSIASLNGIWKHNGDSFDIMSYRVIEETKDQEIEEVKVADVKLEMMQGDSWVTIGRVAPDFGASVFDGGPLPKEEEVKDTNLGTITYKLEIDATEATQRIDSLVAKWGKIVSPLKWRDAIIHCQAIIEDCEREIERNVNLLDAEGLMMQKDSKKAMQHYALDVDFSDWRNWQIGDRVCATKNFDDVDIGDELIITRLDHADEEQPIGMSAGSSSTSWPKMSWVKFIRRP